MNEVRSQSPVDFACPGNGVLAAQLLAAQPGTERSFRPGLGGEQDGRRGGATIVRSSDASSGRRAERRRGGRLVVVSNRVADPATDTGAGGLAVALGDVLEATRGLWVGWSGVVRADAHGRGPNRRLAGGVELMTLDLTPDEYENYYLGYDNRCLWPVLHFRADLIRYRRDYLDAYWSVNRRFASALVPLLREDDTIWVHDYHLMPLGRELRRQGPLQPIGFFLHVPFPPPDVLAALPGHRDLLRDLMAYDVVGFQTNADVERFRACIVALANGEVKLGGRVSAFGAMVRAVAAPVGIDVDAFAALATGPAARRHADRLRAAVGRRDLIIGVDRLDYAKGLPLRFEGYRRLLERFPDRRNTVSYLQLAPLSRQEVEAYAELRNELDRLSGSINGSYAELDWTPIRYHLQRLTRPKLAGLYRAAQVGLVTPLRDGMNLVAKEFVAAQGPEDPGVLVLSRFAGAAESLTDALIVNPCDPEETAEALNRALTMPLDERRERHRALLERIRAEDVHAWRRGFLAALAGTDTPALGSLAVNGDAAPLPGDAVADAGGDDGPRGQEFRVDRDSGR